MSNINDCYGVLKEISSRLDLAEELLKIIAVNDLIDGLNDIEIQDNSIELNKNIKTIFDNYEIVVEKKDEFCGNLIQIFQYLFIISQMSVKPVK